MLFYQRGHLKLILRYRYLIFRFMQTADTLLSTHSSGKLFSRSRWNSLPCFCSFCPWTQWLSLSLEKMHLMLIGKVKQAEELAGPVLDPSAQAYIQIIWQGTGNITAILDQTAFRLPGGSWEILIICCSQKSCDSSFWAQTLLQRPTPRGWIPTQLGMDQFFLFSLPSQWGNKNVPSEDCCSEAN